MNLEVSIQDCFWSSETENNSLSDHPDSDNSLSNNPISEETWHNWFSKWLEYLLQLKASAMPTTDSNVMLEELLGGENYELTLRLTDDGEIQSLNSQYRGKDQPTDVLAFAALETAGPDLSNFANDLPIYLGDLVISIDTAEKQASSRGHILSIELAWLASHGFLHLLGWDHPDEESLQAMLAQQKILLRTVGLDTPNYD